jgi:site-specific DNA recombinase
LEGCSLGEAARRLEQLGARSRRRQHGWNRGTIGQMLRNPAYRGQAAYGKKRVGERRPRPRPVRGQPEIPKQPHSLYSQPVAEHISIAVPALVADELFDAVQERLQDNRRRLREGQRGPRYLLQGLMVCACCGYAICGRPSGTYGYYFCPGSEPCRFGGERLCSNRRQRREDMEAAVWNDVCALLREPERLREELARRQDNPATKGAQVESERLLRTIAKVKQGISRLIDIYTGGLVETSEFEPRMRGLKDRLATLEKEYQAAQQRTQQAEELHLACSRLEEFADQITSGLDNANWSQKREILRALVKRIEVDKEAIRIVYKVSAHPFAKAPNGGHLQDCRRPGCGPVGAVVCTLEKLSGRPEPKLLLLSSIFLDQLIAWRKKGRIKETWLDAIKVFPPSRVPFLFEHPPSNCPDVDSVPRADRCVGRCERRARLHLLRWSGPTTVAAVQFLGCHQQP